MTSTEGEAATTEDHTAPPEAWGAIAAGYDRHVAPQEADMANEALHLVALEPGERFLDVAAGTGDSACRPRAWGPRCSPPTGHPR